MKYMNFCKLNFGFFGCKKKVARWHVWHAEK